MGRRWRSGRRGRVDGRGGSHELNGRIALCKVVLKITLVSWGIF